MHLHTSTHHLAARHPRLLVLDDVRLGQRLDGADHARAAVPRQADAPKAARPQDTPHFKVIEAAGL